EGGPFPSWTSPPGTETTKVSFLRGFGQLYNENRSPSEEVVSGDATAQGTWGRVMSSLTQCAHCGHPTQAADPALGVRSRCPKCSSVLTPGPGPQPAPGPEQTSEQCWIRLVGLGALLSSCAAPLCAWAPSLCGLVIPLAGGGLLL